MTQQILRADHFCKGPRRVVLSWYLLLLDCMLGDLDQKMPYYAK